MQHRRSSTAYCDPQERGYLSAQGAEDALNLFKQTFTPQFPFVVIRPSITANDLKLERPFLFLTIVTAASYANVPLQRRLASNVIESISATVARGEFATLDMLQGLIVFLAWYVSP